MGRKPSRSRDQRGAVAVLVAFMMVALMVTGGIVMDIGLARLDKDTNKSAADQAVAAGLQSANSGTGDVYNSSAVCAAYQYLVNERASLSGLPADVCSAPSTTATCTPGDSTTNVSYHGTTTSGIKRYEVWIKMPYSLSDTTTGGPFTEETSYSTLSADPSDSTQQGCDQLGVVIKEWTQPGLSRVLSTNELATRIRSVSRLKVGNGDPAPALLLLERSRCGVLTVGSAGSPSRIKVYGSTTSPGTIHSDSDATDSGCGTGSNSQLLQGKQTSGVVAYGATNGVSGLITSVATQLGKASNIVSDGTANVYATTASSELSTGTTSDVMGRKRVTRKPVDRRYLSGVGTATRAASSVWAVDHSTAPGFTRFGCPTAANMTTMSSMTASQSVYIDCPGNSGLTVSGTIGAGTIYVHGFVKGGNLSMPNATKIYVDDTDNSGGRVSADAVSVSNGNTLCVRATSCVNLATGSCSTTTTGNPGAKAMLMTRRGGISGTGGLMRLCNTTVVMEGGDPGDGSATKPGGCLPLTNGTAPTSVPCSASTAAVPAGDGLLSTSGDVDWTAPNAYSDMNAAGLSPAQQQTLWDGGEDLALWTESYGTSTQFGMAGGGAMRVAGVFMVPNAFPFNLSGSGAQDLTNAQYVVRAFAVGGGATLTMKVDPNNVVGLPSLYDFRLVR